ncbi:hypothetical protein I5L01_04760 [Erythrobacter sp. YJ-T3-07]|uniref:hypothetical protein n=1 Tax=Erythrobacter sp. YJ-T3-07 TaxID=2793063 RepID=UPI0018D3E804|nr:hypothetical protein [Erythrobacter sp. YJ-T3-07]MBH1943540.1 hypothetical protein [Erythrobacter sp. YJ-T3-07]
MISRFVVFASAASLIPSPVLAEQASQLTDINGALGRDAERVLQQRGFAHISTNKNSMGYVYSYWWDDEDDTCVQVEVYDGRVETISDASSEDCGHSGGGDAAAALGVAAGVAILGALLTHKSHHHDDNAHSSDEQAERDYERGYTDGLHNAAYHNPGRSEAYASGYSAGVDERSANIDHHSGRGGYDRAAEFSDLKGARAAGAMDELERRGFRQVDNFASGTTRYSIQWQPESRQCVQVTIADGRFYDLRDIGQHPKCR